MGSSTERWRNARVCRVPLFPRGRKSGLRLALNYLSFVFSAGMFGPWMLRNVRPDVILVYSPSPLLQALPALLIGRLKRVPVVIYVQDLWPESLEATGYVRNGFALALVEGVVRFIYRHARLILASSRPFVPAIMRFKPPGPVVYYPNSVDESFGNPDAKIKPDVPSLSADSFSVVFAGNVGSAQAVHVIVDAAQRLRDNRSIRLVVLGSGSELEWMKREKEVRQLDNLVIAGRFPVESMPYLLSRASALLVSLADRPIFAGTVPNKIQAYMAVGRPIIACMNGEGARIVSEAQAGLTVPAEDSEGLAGAILRLWKMSPEERETLGKNGRAYYREHFDHEKLVSKLINHLEEVIGKRQ